MRIKPPTLSSRIAANLLREATNHSEIRHTLGVIDLLSEIYDALEKSAEATSPHETKEARAMRFEKAYSAAVERAKDLTSTAARFLDTLANDANFQALNKSGLWTKPESAAEIRAALRQMTPAAREKAIADAFAANDAEILSSIYKANSVIWGGVKAPLDAMFDGYIDLIVPERAVQIGAADQAAQMLGFATDGLLKAAEQWRDPESAARGEEQAQQFSNAKAELDAAFAASVNT